MAMVIIGSSLSPDRPAKQPPPEGGILPPVAGVVIPRPLALARLPGVQLEWRLSPPRTFD